MPVESRKAQLEAMQSSKQSDFAMDFERDSARNAKVLSNPTTLARAEAPSANAGAAFASVAEHEKACSSGDFERQVASRHARAAISSGQWLRSTAEEWFRAQSTPCAVFSSAVGRFGLFRIANSSRGFNI